MTDPVKLLSDDEVVEIEAQLERFLSALTFGEPAQGNRYVESVDGNFYFEENADNEFDAFDLLRQFPALCATVRALRQQIAELTAEWCQCGHAKTQHGFFSDHDECYECDQMSDDLCCEWRPAPRVTDTYTALREQLAKAQDSLIAVRNCQNLHCGHCAALLRATLEKQL